MSTWNRPDAMEFAKIMKDHIVPHYQLLFESFAKAQAVQRDATALLTACGLALRSFD